MYTDNNQLWIEDFVFPYGNLDPENDWVRLAALVPWDVAEDRCTAQFASNGHHSHPTQMTWGALLLQRLKCNNEWPVKHVGEAPYLRYFISMKGDGPHPFGASTLVVLKNNRERKFYNEN